MTPRDPRRAGHARVVVVGASAAGLHAAGLLARAGVGVRVLERSRVLRPRPRSLVVTQAFRAQLPADCQGCVVAEVARYELHASGRIRTVELDAPDLVIERARLISDLAARARAAGAELSLGARCTDVRATGSGLALGLQVGTGREDIQARQVVAADGAFSGLARILARPVIPTVVVLQAIISWPRGLDPQTSRIWFRPADTSYFYWLMATGPGRGVLGFIVEPGGPSPRTLLDAFLASQGLVALGYQSARIPRFRRWVDPHHRVGDGSVYFVGDAAGHVKVSTVGGIVTGLAGAAAAVRAVLGEASDPGWRRLRRELTLHRVVHDALERFDDADYARLLAALDAGARRSLGSITRDDVTGLLGEVLTHRPQLLLVAARALLPSHRPSRATPEPPGAPGRLVARPRRELAGALEEDPC